jgi:hypothetical protein
MNDRYQIIWDIDNTVFNDNICSIKKSGECIGINNFIKLTNWNGLYIFLTGRPEILNKYTIFELATRLGIEDDKIVIYNADIISGIFDGCFGYHWFTVNDKCSNYYNICSDYPKYKFIYIGDSGKVDPEVIKKVGVEGYLRRLDKNKIDHCSGIALFDDYNDLTKIFIKKGLIDK